MQIGLQVYSLREALSKDFDGTMKAVAGMGYQGVELFGSLPANTKSLLKDLGLKVPSKHGVYDEFVKDVQAHLDQVSDLGGSVLVCAWSMPGADYGWEKITENLEAFAQAAKKQGLSFAYHNHAHELLQKVGDKTVFDYMATNAPTVQFEQDIAWVHAGLVDPVTYLETYADRTPLIHVKDVKAKADGWDTVELGKGDVNLSAALKAATKTRSQWLLIEQDHSDDPIRSAKNNLEWLKQHQVA
jgi:sugar phosphate isomerase/epimerase